tara:strand:- start:324 stop:515 length:192 start_codon:yes stop_codon:yes gene_type:complete
MVDFSRHVKVGGMDFDASVENYYQSMAQFLDRTMDTYEVIQYAQGEPLESTRYNYEEYTGILY